MKQSHFTPVGWLGDADTSFITCLSAVCNKQHWYSLATKFKEKSSSLEFRIGKHREQKP